MDTTVFTRGIPVHALKEEWSSLLLVIQKFITCEGHFGSMYMQHARLMMNFLEGHTLNLPHFMLLSLKNMSFTVQKHIGNIESHLYHHGFIKILIKDQLKKTKDTWEQFLIRNYFQEPSEASGSSPPKIPRKIRRKEKNITVQDSLLQKLKKLSKKEKKIELNIRNRRKKKAKEPFKKSIHPLSNPQKRIINLCQKYQYTFRLLLQPRKSKKENIVHKRRVLVHT